MRVAHAFGFIPIVLLAISNFSEERSALQRTSLTFGDGYCVVFLSVYISESKLMLLEICLTTLGVRPVFLLPLVYVEKKQR